jgi:uracil-DNA glycosylase
LAVEARPGENEQIGAIATEIAACVRCPRLVAWRRDVADRAPAAYAGETYWARGLPGFGDPTASVVLVGLAPAAHGGNRTGRMFTGDRSGDFLFAALHRAGFANQAPSHDVDDGLALSGAFITAAVRCAPPDNKPTPTERATCAPYLTAELAALTNVRVVVALGAIAYDAVRRDASVTAPSPAARFAHGLEVPITCAGRDTVLLCSYHPSQRNVFTGLLDAPMLDEVLVRARELAGPTPATP